LTLVGPLLLADGARPVAAQIIGRWARAPEVAGAASPRMPPIIAGANVPEHTAAAAVSAGIPDRWKTSAELSLTDQSGNQVLRLVSGGIRFSHREKEAFELDGVLQTRYGRSGEKVVARNHFASLAFDLHPRDAWSPFLYFTAERDPLRRLDVRFAGGAGAKYTPFEVPAVDEVSLSLALLYSVENLRPSESDPDPLDRALARWSLRLKAAREVSENLNIQHVSSYEPVWHEMADYLLRSETGARVHLTERLALSVTYALDRTARPPEGVEPDDRLLKTGLIIDF
jgi:hypothetical protein